MKVVGKNFEKYWRAAMVLLFLGFLSAEGAMFPIPDPGLTEEDAKAVAACDLVLIEQLVSYHPELADPESGATEMITGSAVGLGGASAEDLAPGALAPWLDDEAPLMTSGFSIGWVAALLMVALPFGIRNWKGTSN